MARSRNLKPGFFINEHLADIEPLGRLLFAGLWLVADREGRLEDRPKRIKAELLPYDDCDVEQLLQALAKRQFILRYFHEDSRFIQIVNFSKHQNPHKNEKPSEIPAPRDITKLHEHSHTSSDKIGTARYTLTMPETIPSDKENTPTLESSLEVKHEEDEEVPDENFTKKLPATDDITKLHEHSHTSSDKIGTTRADSLSSDSLFLDLKDHVLEKGRTQEELNITTAERLALHQLSNIANYPYDYSTDLTHLRQLAIDYPTVDLVEELKRWKTWLIDNPLKPRSNPRLQIRNWLKNASKWRKEGGDDDDTCEPENRTRAGKYAEFVVE